MKNTTIDKLLQALHTNDRNIMIDMIVEYVGGDVEEQTYNKEGLQRSRKRDLRLDIIDYIKEEVEDIIKSKRK